MRCQENMGRAGDFTRFFVAHDLNFCGRMTDLGSVPAWLGIIAVALVIQAVVMLVAAVVAWRAMARSTAALDALRRDEIAPFVARIDAVLDGAHRVMGRVEAADADVRAAMARTSVRARQTAMRVKHGFWPAVGIGRGAWALVSAFRRRSPRLNAAGGRSLEGAHHVHGHLRH